MEHAVKTNSGESPRTLPGLLLRNAEQFGDGQVALREKEFGIWQRVTWQQYLEHVRDFSLGLSAIGLQPGEALGIIGDNRPEWVYAELAVQAAGGVPLGIFQDAIIGELSYIIDHSGRLWWWPRTRSRWTKSWDSRRSCRV